MNPESEILENPAEKTRWRRRKELRPGEILKAALDCFSERGFSATRLDDIASRANVTKGTLYLYFPGKEELFKSVVREEIVANIAQFEVIAADLTLSPTDLIRKLLLFWAEIFAKTRIGVLPKLIIAEGSNFPELAKFYIDEVINRGFRLIGEIVQRGIERGEFRPVDVESTVRCIIAPALFAMIWRNALEPHSKHKLDVEKLFQTHIELILRGLQADSTSQNRLR